MLAGPGDDDAIEGATRGGEVVWVRRSLRVIDCLGEPMILGSVVDVTAKKTAEDELRRSEQELNVLSGQLLLAQEEERKRIALELHDGIGQTLSAIKFGLENTMQECDKNTREQNLKYLASVVDKLRTHADRKDYLAVRGLTELRSGIGVSKCSPCVRWPSPRATRPSYTSYASSL